MSSQDHAFKRLFNALWISTPFLLPFPTAMAACTLTPTAGNDTYVCDSGTSPGLTDLSGNNSLTMPANGSGVIQGDVTFDDGADHIEIHANGVIDGDVSQGSEADDFLMTGGRILSLSQGDGLDTFTMSGGTIVDAFEDGDIAHMSGGTIGRVDMKLDDNLFDMSGGVIDITGARTFPIRSKLLRKSGYFAASFFEIFSSAAAVRAVSSYRQKPPPFGSGAKARTSGTRTSSPCPTSPRSAITFAFIGAEYLVPK